MGAHDKENFMGTLRAPRGLRGHPIIYTFGDQFFNQMSFYDFQENQKRNGF